MQDISATAMEQQTGVDQVNRAVAEMDTVTQHNASLVQESANTSESLLAQAHVLKDTVSFFKLSADDLKRDNTAKVKKEVKKEFNEVKENNQKQKTKTPEIKKQNFEKKTDYKEDSYEEHKSSSKKELKVPPSVERARAMESQKQDNTTVRNDEFGVTYSSTSNGMTDDGFASF